MTTRVEIPLGRVEDQRFELKSREALKRPESIAREVVAMLNANGGEIWIGIREENGRAMEIEPIEDAESARDRLWDHLVDSLEPALRHDEVRIEVVDLPGSGMEEARLFRLEVTPTGGHRPYAFLKGSAWHFPIRVGARLRPMTREEIVGNRAEGKGGPTDAPGADLGEARSALLEWRNQEREGRSGLWLGIVTAPPLSLDLQLLPFDELAAEPRASGNRTSGWNFARSLKRPELRSDHIEWGHATKWYDLDVEVFEDGRAMFFVGFPKLARKGEKIWPFTLLEYPISAIRILGRIYQEVDKEFRVLCDLSLFDIGGRELRPGSPGSIAFDLDEPGKIEDGNDVLFERPLEFSRMEVVNEPDRCGFRLLRRVYQAFGHREDAIPAEYDRKSGRLILPE